MSEIIKGVTENEVDKLYGLSLSSPYEVTFDKQFKYLAEKHARAILEEFIDDHHPEDSLNLGKRFVAGLNDMKDGETRCFNATRKYPIGITVNTNTPLKFESVTSTTGNGWRYGIDKGEDKIAEVINSTEKDITKDFGRVYSDLESSKDALMGECSSAKIDIPTPLSRRDEEARNFIQAIEGITNLKNNAVKSQQYEYGADCRDMESKLKRMYEERQKKYAYSREGVNSRETVDSSFTGDSLSHEFDKKLYSLVNLVKLPEEHEQKSTKYKAGDEVYLISDRKPRRGVIKDILFNTYEVSWIDDPRGGKFCSSDEFIDFPGRP